MKTKTDLGLLKGQDVAAATAPADSARVSLSWDKEYYDVAKWHSDPNATGGFPSIFPSGGQALYVVGVELHLDAKPADGLQMSVAQYKRDTNDLVRDVRVVDVTERSSVHTFLVGMSDANKFRIDLLNGSGQPVKVTSAYLTIGG